MNIKEETLSLLRADRPVIGVSGGIDSMTLLHLLVRNNINPIVAHINYQKRGIESDKDEALVQAYCRKHSITFVCSRIKITAKGNFQKHARLYRYNFFDKIIKQFGSKWIVTAHHRDDFYETIMMRLKKRKSILSLNPFSEISNGRIRPMISTSKDEIKRYANVHEVPFRFDESNLSNDFERNKIRNISFNRFKEAKLDYKRCLDLVAIFATHYKLFIERALQLCSDRGLLIIEEVKKLNYTQQRDVVREWVFKKTGIRITYSSLDNLLNNRELQTGKSFSVHSGFEILIDREVLRLIQKENGFEYNVTTIEFLPEKDVAVNPYLKLQSGKWLGYPQEGVLEINATKIKWPITVRTWKAGDRVRLFGKPGSQLVSDLLTNQKVPAVQKQTSLVIETFDDKICAVIFGTISGSFTGKISGFFACDTIGDDTLIIKFT